MGERRQSANAAACRGAEASLDIAGISIAISRHEGGPAVRIEGASARFPASAREPSVRIGVRWGELGDAAPGRAIFDSGAHWRLFDDGGAYTFAFRSPGLGALPYRTARFSRDFRRGDVVFHRPYFDADAALDPLGYPLDELLVMHLLGEGLGVELHACGVVDADGRGHLFVGQSGAGKTTMARHWERRPGAVVLSDDRIVVRRHADGLRMHGTPWHGEAGLSVQGSAPLARVYFITHGKAGDTTPVLKPVRGAAYSARLFSCVFCPFYRRSAVEFTVDALGDIAARVPGYELRYRPGTDAAAALAAFKD